jgi:hypothetical protein
MLWCTSDISSVFIFVWKFLWHDEVSDIMRPASETTYETGLPSSRNQRANLDDSGTEEAFMSSSVINDWP